MQAPDVNQKIDGQRPNSSLRDLPFSAGFVLTAGSLPSVAHFHRLSLDDRWTFWHDDRCEIELSRADGVTALIHGRFYHLEGEPADVIASRLCEAYRSSPTCFEKELDNLVGRYIVLVSDGEDLFLYHDPLGTRSVYYDLDSPTISSHFNLLAELTGARKSKSWNELRLAMDLTPSETIRQLLPNFCLEANSRKVSRYFPVSENAYRNLPHEDKLAEIIRLWTTSTTALLENYKNVSLSLSSGIDSRVSAAMTSEHWHKINIFTYGMIEPEDTQYSKIMNTDYIISQRLVDLIQPADYEFLDLATNEKVTGELKSLLNQNSLSKHGPALIQRYRSKYVGDSWIHIRSNGLEVARERYLFSDSSDSFSLARKYIERRGATDYEHRVVPLGLDHSHFGYSLRDLLYWELNMGKWHSEVLNESDAAFETILPHNNRRILKLLLAFPEEDRRSNFPIYELINLQAPMLNFFGVNDTRNLYEIRRDEVREKQDDGLARKS